MLQRWPSVEAGPEFQLRERPRKRGRKRHIHQSPSSRSPLERHCPRPRGSKASRACGRDRRTRRQVPSTGCPASSEDRSLPIMRAKRRIIDVFLSCAIAIDSASIASRLLAWFIHDRGSVRSALSSPERLFPAGSGDGARGSIDVVAISERRAWKTPPRRARLRRTHTTSALWRRHEYMTAVRCSYALGIERSEWK